MRRGRRKRERRGRRKRERKKIERRTNFVFLALC